MSIGSGMSGKLKVVSISLNNSKRDLSILVIPSYITTTTIESEGIPIFSNSARFDWMPQSVLRSAYWSTL